MLHFSRWSLLVLALLIILAGCTIPATPGNKGSSQNNPATTDKTAGICPTPLRDFKGCFTPHELRLAYGVEALYQKGFRGKGQTVIDIVSFGSPTLKEDMEVFDKTFGLPPADVETISPLNIPESDPNKDKEGWASETTLDVQIIHAIAPEAKIIVLTSPVAETQGTIGLPEFRQLEQYVIDKKLGTIVSQSWGASEATLQDEQGRQEMQRWNELLQKATTQLGITYFSSSGDHGATDFTDLQSKKLSTRPTTSFAANSPWVTSVGGTTLQDTGSTFSERVWNSGGGASGGGFSSFNKTPDYQKTLPPAVQQQLNNRRGVPDVSAAADPTTGLAFYQSGQWSIAGGTSASAPLWAGIMAIANQMAGRPLGFINPGLYKLAQSSNDYREDFRDVTEGNNSNAGVKGYDAVPGWDASTGLGSPIADKLIPDLINAAK